MQTARSAGEVPVGQTDRAMPPHPVIEGYYANERERPEAVQTLFDASAPAYDRITGMMSFGSGALYRRDALRRAGVGAGGHVLDIACGTGQVSAAAMQLVGSSGRVIGVDPSPEMRRVAEERRGIETVAGSAEQLPFDDASFDFVTMGYALRHVSDLLVAFQEMRRVLKPGGTVFVLEITPPKRRVSYHLIRLYLKSIVPAATRLTSSNRDAAKLMSYYWETIEQCVPPERILAAMSAADLETPKRDVIAGIFSEYTAASLDGPRELRPTVSDD